MAISGSFYGTTSNSAIKPKITWTATENIEGNYSDVTAKLSYSRTDSYKTYGHWAGSLTINGDKKSVSGKYVEITKNSNTVTISHTVRVPHDDDGTKTIKISASGGITETTLTKTSISSSVALMNIPRAASIAATDADIGSVSMVTIGKKSDIYTYMVAYQFGNLSGYLSENGLSAAAVHTTASSLAFSLPESFYYEIPTKPSDLCNLTCTTYLAGTAIGTPQQTTFTVRADPARCGPALTAAVEDANTAALALTGNKTRFIRYVSTARCSMSVQSRHGASITQKKIAGQTVTGNTLTLNGVQADSVRFSATDSRGYTTETVIPLNVVPYFSPVQRLSAARSDATSGNAVLTAEGSFYNGSFGASTNSLRVQYRVGDGNPVTVQPEISGNSFRVQVQLNGLDYTQSHLLTLTASDALSSVSAQARINPGIPVFEWGKEDFVFHVPVRVQGRDLLSEVDGRIARSGDTMSGALAMGGNRVTGLGAPQTDSDAATKAYADSKTAVCKLWENADPTANFDAQTIALDLSSYQWVAINCRFKTDNSQMKMHFGLVGTTIGMDVISSSGYRGLRKATVTTMGVQFATATYNDNDGVVGYIIPTQIYGIRGIQ